MSAWSWPGSQVVKVVDGDTIDVIVRRDLGFDGGEVVRHVRLRLARINAPKGAATRGAAATSRVVALLSTAPTVDLVTLKPYKYGSPEGQSGEYMAEVTLPDGTNLSDVLVGEGLAVTWNGRGPRPADD